MKNNERYLKEVSVLSDSGCGVMMTRTREPFRAIASLREFAFNRNLPFSIWNIMEGWKTWLPNDDPDAAPKAMPLVDAYEGMKWIRDVNGAGANAKESGVFVMHAVHPWMKRGSEHPGIIECLRQYVRAFSESEHPLKLILVVPEGAPMPDELSHDIPLVDFDLPSLPEIAEIFEYVTESSTHPEREVPEVFTAGHRETLVASAGGLTQMEAELAFSKAYVENKPADVSSDSMLEQWADRLSFDSFNGSVLAMKTDVVKQSQVLELMEAVDMGDVGGLDQLKEWVFIAADAFTAEARAYGVDVPNGIAAIGPPGTGKTLIGKAIATALGQPLVKFDVSKCFAGIVGESEDRVRSALKQLEAMGRVTVLFDEIDKSLGGSHQAGGDSGVSKRVLGSILTFMQETKAPIFPIYTANRTDSLPPELLRKGRLDEVFAVMPPNYAEREAIFRIHLRKRKQDPDSLPGDMHETIRISKGYVSSELEAAVKEAVKYSFHRKTPMTWELIAEQLRGMRPLSEAFPDDFEAMSEWARNNAKLASTPCEEPEEAPSGTTNAEASRPRSRRRAISAGVSQ